MVYGESSESTHIHVPISLTLMTLKHKSCVSDAFLFLHNAQMFTITSLAALIKHYKITHLGSHN